MWSSLLFKRLISVFRRLPYWQMCVALLLSVVLHVYVLDKMYFYEPKAEFVVQQPLAANLVVIQPAQVMEQAVKRTPEPANREVVEPKLLPKKLTFKPVPVREIDAVPAAQVERPAEMLSVEASAQVVETAAQPLEATDAEPVVTEPVATQLLEAEAAELHVNHDTYEYVETTFGVYTDKELAAGTGPVGEANMVYEERLGGAQYHIKSTVHAKGLAAMFIPDLVQTSDGIIAERGLQPTHYLYQFGDKANKTFQADFDWSSNQIHLHSAKGDQTLPLALGTQDLLSFMYQFMFMQPLQNMQLTITNGKKIGEYQYSFEGEEVLNSPMGELKVIHLLRASAENEKKTELWLAADYQYVPVKIRETDKSGKVYELVVKHLNTTKPSVQ